MRRTPEPELMEDDGQARAYAEADFAAPHDHFVQLLQESLKDLPPTGMALELGCGPADVTTRFAHAYPGWGVVGVDGSAAMLRYGHATLVRAGLQDRVSLIMGHLPEDGPPEDAYGLVFSNALLHHLARPSTLWNSLRRWVRKGTPVFVMDLMRPASRADAWRLVQSYAANEPEVLRHDFLHSLLAAYRPGEVRDQLIEARMGHLGVKAVSDRHLVVCGRL